MKLTKYSHACFTIESQGSKLIVDPGIWTKLPDVLTNVEAIIITHEHADHFHPDNITKIQTQNPSSQILTTESVARRLPLAIPVKPKSEQTTKKFRFQFFGGEHAFIHSSAPKVQNLSILINDKVYYPGDSYFLPEKPPPVLLMPLAAPWLKVSESIKFLREAKATTAFPTHDYILSDEGKELYDRIINQAAKRSGTRYIRLNAGDQYDV